MPPPTLRVFTLYHKKKGTVRSMIVQDGLVKRMSAGKTYTGKPMREVITYFKRIGYTVTELVELGEQE